MNTDTPETDAATWIYEGRVVVCPSFARRLERERDELRRWTSVNGVSELQRELNEARKERETAREIARCLHKHMSQLHPKNPPPKLPW